MKKLILSLIVLFTINICLSQNKKSLNKTSIETVYKDSKNGISTVYNDLKSTTPQIKNALESLSKELKTTTDSLWFILVKQQLVWSWCFLILIVSSLINWIMFYRFNFNPNLKYDKVKVVVQKHQNKDGASDDDIKKYPHTYGKQFVNVEEESFKLIPTSTIPWFKYVHLAICITLSVFSFLHFSDMLTGFINPEFGALKTITEVVKNLK